jgi:hypothetical protein
MLDPTTPTVGASGAIFGILGAGLVLERQRDYVFGGSALGVIVINLVFTFSVANISIGGHIGGADRASGAHIACARGRLRDDRRRRRGSFCSRTGRRAGTRSWPRRTERAPFSVAEPHPRRARAALPGVGRRERT